MEGGAMLRPQLGRLLAVDPRQVWRHEAREFTPWLFANPEPLADALGIDLEFTAMEHPVGGFLLDLIGRDLTNNAVLIVENQLEATDHVHLGQILTYAAGTATDKPSTIVWIATCFREEHRQALDWLNQSTGEGTHFFGLEIRVVEIADPEQIEDSPRAPLFKVVAEPNEWQKQLRAATEGGELGGKRALYVAFWGQLLDRVREQHPDWTRAAKPPADNWISMPSPIKGGPFISASFAAGGRLRHELYIDFGDEARNLALFRSLLAVRRPSRGGVRLRA